MNISFGTISYTRNIIITNVMTVAKAIHVLDEKAAIITSQIQHAREVIKAMEAELKRWQSYMDKIDDLRAQVLSNERADMEPELRNM